MRSFFRAVLLMKSLIAVAGFGWAIGAGLSGAGTVEQAQGRADVHNVALVAAPSGPEARNRRIAP
jgi:hypothetical protein